MGSGESSGRGHHTRTATRGTKRETTAPGPPADEDGPDHRSRTGSRSRTEPERGRARPTPRSDRLAGGWASSGRRSVVSTWGSSGDLDTPVVTAGRWAGTAQSVAAGPVTAVKRFRARRRPALPVGGRGVPAGPGHSSRSAVRRPPCRRLADQSHGLTGIAGTDPAGRRAECDVPARGDRCGAARPPCVHAFEKHSYGACGRTGDVRHSRGGPLTQCPSQCFGLVFTSTHVIGVSSNELCDTAGAARKRLAARAAADRRNGKRC